jgi:hypothetical protein
VTNNQTGRKSMISNSQDIAKDKEAVEISKVRIVLLEKVSDICLMKEEVLEWEKQKREWMVENKETGNLI